jgi:hypothetical protein
MKQASSWTDEYRIARTKAEINAGSQATLSQFEEPNKSKPFYLSNMINHQAEMVAA